MERKEGREETQGRIVGSEGDWWAEGTEEVCGGGGAQGFLQSQGASEYSCRVSEAVIS